MNLELIQPEDVTSEKVDFIENQANRLYDFVLASRELLTKEAHTTIQWLFAIVVGAAGYAATLLKPQTPAAPPEWWLIAPLVVASMIAGLGAFRLFQNAMRATPLSPPGNYPKNLATPEQLSCEVQLIRLREATELQEPIESALAHNRRVGTAINEARWFVALVPLGAILLLVALRLTQF